MGAPADEADPLAAGAIPIRDRFSGEIIGQLPSEDLTLAERFALAREALPRLRALGLEGRLAVVVAFGELLNTHAEELIRLMVHESGQARKFASWELNHVVAMARRFPHVVDRIRPREIPAVFGRNLLRYEPYGVVCVLTSANSPLWAPFVAITSSFGAGNATVVRPATSTRLSAHMLARLLVDAGSPDGAIQIATEPAGELVRATVGRAEVLVAFSGSDRGKENTLLLAEALASTRIQRDGKSRLPGRLVKYLPEMAGNDPFLVLPGTDLKHACATGATAAFANAGQLCMAAKRFLVHESLVAKFEAGLEDEARRLVVGDPRDPSTDIGPLFREGARDQALLQLEEALRAGGRLVFGGRHEGHYFWPTLISFEGAALLALPPEKRPALWREESFAPLRSLVSFRNEDEAVSLANEASYGLGASVFGKQEIALRVAEQLEAGRVFVNEGPFYQDPELPVGGVKDSGLFGSAFKIEQLAYPKRIHLAG